MRATIKQVAERAGVSPMTVSNVLRGRENRASEATRQRVMKAVREFNYIPVRPALQNRHVETHVVGVVLDHTDARWHLLDSEAFDGIRGGAVKFGYDILLHLRPSPDWIRDREEIWLLDRRCDGFIFVNPRRPQDTYLMLEKLVAHEVPAVMCYGGATPPGVASVRPDNDRAMRTALQYVYDRGHRRIAFMAGPDHILDAVQRTAAYAAFAYENKLMRCDPSMRGVWGNDETDLEDGRAMLKVMLADKPTAVVCANTRSALGVWQVAREAGLRVPRDFSLIGIDDPERAAERNLTVITNSFTMAGAAAFTALMDLMAGQSADACSVVLPAEVIERGSVAVIKGN